MFWCYCFSSVTCVFFSLLCFPTYSALIFFDNCYWLFLHNCLFSCSIFLSDLLFSLWFFTFWRWRGRKLTCFCAFSDKSSSKRGRLWIPYMINVLMLLLLCDDDITVWITILFREIVEPIKWFNDDIIVLMILLVKLHYFPFIWKMTKE